MRTSGEGTSNMSESPSNKSEIFRKLCDRSRDGLTIIKNGEVIYINDRLCEILGQPREKIIHSTINEFLIPRDKKILCELVEDAEKTGIKPNKIEFWIDREDGTKRCIQNRYFDDSENENRYRFIITIDLTDDKHILAKLREQEQINKSNGKIQKASITLSQKDSVILSMYTWDFKLGPVMNIQYPKISKLRYSMEDIGLQLFQVSTSIYGQQYFDKAQGVLIEIENINMSGYVFFDIISANKSKTRFMLAILSPKITYNASLKIKEILEEVAIKIKSNIAWNIEECWENVIKVLIST